jgi:hypothetical protein
LKRKNEQTRDDIETAMFMLRSIERDLDEVILRNDQAIRRTSLVSEVLEPAIQRLAQIRKRVRVARSSMSAAWINGQARRWEQNDD